MTGEVIRASKATGTRYECQRPGEPAHMDVKIPDGGGDRHRGDRLVHGVRSAH